MVRDMQANFIRRDLPGYFRLSLGRSVFAFMEARLVYRLAYNGDVAAGQLAVFQGGPSRTGGKAPISESYGSSKQRGKTANWPRPGGLR